MAPQPSWGVGGSQPSKVLVNIVKENSKNSATNVSISTAKTIFLSTIRTASRVSSPQKVTLSTNESGVLTLKTELLVDAQGNVRYETTKMDADIKSNLQVVGGKLYIQKDNLPESLVVAAEQIEELDGQAATWYTQPAKQEHRFEQLFLKTLDNSGVAQSLSEAKFAKKIVKGKAITWTLSGEKTTLVATTVNNVLTTISNQSEKGRFELKIVKVSNVKLTPPVGTITNITRLTEYITEQASIKEPSEESAPLSGSSLKSLAEEIMKKSILGAAQNGGAVTIDEVAQALELLTEGDTLSAQFISSNPVQVEFSDPNDALQRVCADFSKSSVIQGACQ